MICRISNQASFGRNDVIATDKVDGERPFESVSKNQVTLKRNPLSIVSVCPHQYNELKCSYFFHIRQGRTQVTFAGVEHKAS